MKFPIIIANWKMKLNSSDALKLAKKVAKSSAKYKSAEVVLCPPFTEIASVGELIQKSKIKLGAQDCFWEESGAFTGEISPVILKEYNVTHVIVGHSERRQNLKETSEMIHRKVQLLIKLGMVPVLCVGETFEQRQQGDKEIILIREITSALDGIWLDEMSNIIVAYEPIWVIGSGQAVAPDEAEHTHQVIKQTMYDIFPDTMVDEQIKIIYGGSVDPENVSGFIQQSTVDGVLVGGASLDASEFSAIVASALKSD